MSSDWYEIPEDLAEDFGGTIPAQAVDNCTVTLEQCLKAGADGVDIPNEHYHALPGISASNLSLLAESNKHLNNKHLFFCSTPALVFGSLLHTFVLEPKEVMERYKVMPADFEPKTKTGITKEQARIDFILKNSDKTIVDAAAFSKAQRMSQNVHAICGDIIDQGIKERSLFAEIDGLVLKTRLDIDIEPDGDDYDLKSISLGMKDFSDYTLEKHIKKFGYHRSAAFRNIVRRHLGKPVRDSYLIFCNTGPGHMVRVVKINPLWVKEAEAEVNDLLDERRYFIKTGIDRPVTEIDDRAADRLRKLYEQ